MRVVVKEPGKPAEVRDIKNDYATLRDLVGGYIEVVKFPGGSLMACNEEGKLLGLPRNFDAGLDIIVGTVVIVSQRGAEFAALTEKEADRVVSLLSTFRSW